LAWWASTMITVIDTRLDLPVRFRRFSDVFYRRMQSIRVGTRVCVGGEVWCGVKHEARQCVVDLVVSDVVQYVRSWHIF
jgi:hypothetical protein